MVANLAFGQAAGLIGLSSLGNFVGSGLGQFFSGRKMYRQYKYQRALQEQAAQLNYNYQLDSARNLPGAQRQGLESAGYNPLLALGNFNATNGYTSAGSAGIATDPNIDIAGDAVNAYKVGKLERDMNKKQQEQIDSIIKNNEANTANAYEQAKTEEMKRQHYQSQIDLNSIQQQLGRKDLDWRDRLYLKDIETAYTNAAANRLGAQAAMSNASTARQVGMFNAETERYNSKTRRLESITGEFRRLDDRHSTPAKWFSNTSKDMLNYYHNTWTNYRNLMK